MRREQHQRRLRGDQGAVLVEFALFAPVAVILAMGLLEFGMLFKDVNTVRSATRAGARSGANTFTGGGNSDLADYSILVSLKAGLAGLEDDADLRVVIYEASSADGEPSSTCKDYVPPGDFGNPGESCNVYTGEFLTDLSDDPADWNTAWDDGWNPAARDVSGSDGDGTDFLGVAVVTERPAVTGFFGGTMGISDTMVVQLEPCFDLDVC